MTAPAEHHEDQDEAPHGTLTGYLIGFALAVVLTALPFWLVMSGVLHDKAWIVLAIFAFATLQIAVHAVFFLHLNTRSEGGWTLMAFAFTVVVVAIIVSGSIWIMYHLNANMMPMQAPDISQAP